MPAAFKHAGVIPGCIGTILVALIATHCVHILVSRRENIHKDYCLSTIKRVHVSTTYVLVLVFKVFPHRLRSIFCHIERERRQQGLMLLINNSIISYIY